MARILDETDGFVKIVSDARTKKILGASLIGPRATELIATLTFALQTHSDITDLKATMFGHPTISESIVDSLRNYGV